MWNLRLKWKQPTTVSEQTSQVRVHTSWAIGANNPSVSRWHKISLLICSLQERTVTVSEIWIVQLLMQPWVIQVNLLKSLFSKPVSWLRCAGSATLMCDFCCPKVSFNKSTNYFQWNQKGYLVKLIWAFIQKRYHLCLGEENSLLKR